MKLRFLCAVAALVALSCAACGHGKAHVAGLDYDGPNPSTTRDGGARAVGEGDHVFLVDVPEGAIGPHWARGEKGALVAYVGPPEVDQRAVMVLPVSRDGESRGPAKAVAVARVDANTLIVRALTKGYFVGWTELTDKGEVLRAVVVGDDGKAVGNAFDVNRTLNDIVWFEVKPTSTGALVAWAEAGKDGLANVIVLPLDADGAPSSVPVRVAQGARGWQLASANDGVAMVLETTSPNREGNEVDISILKLSPDGQPKAAPIVLQAATHAAGDVDAVRLTSAWLVAWTEHARGPSSVVTALLRDGGGGPQIMPLTDGTTPADLVALASNGDDAIAVYGEPSRRSRSLKNMYLAHISATGVDGTRAALETSVRSVELTRAGAGFALGCEVSACGVNGHAASEGDAPCEIMRPALVSLRKDGGVLSRTILTLGTSEPSFAWDDQCGEKNCVVLAAESGGTVAHVHAVRVALAEKPSVDAPAMAVAPEVKKRLLLDATTVTHGQAIADIAATPLVDGELVAVLTNSIDDGSKKTGGSELSVRFVDKDGKAAASSVVSARALPIGGVSIASAGKPDDGAVLTWVARENGHAEVHVTKVDKRGKRVMDAQLTTAGGETSDVAITKIPMGYLVAWVDGRNKNGEVYATIVSADLQRIAREERITNAPGDASDIALATIGDGVIIAWADPRESPQDGFADIYTATLGLTDAKKRGNEARLLATATHSRSPVMMRAGENMHIAWIEDASTSADAAQSPSQGAMLATLDPKGAMVGAPLRLTPAAHGAAVAVALGVGPVPFAVAARAGGDDIGLDWFDLSLEKPSAPVPLGLLDGPPSMDVSLAIARDSLYFSDEGPEAADRRARRLHIALP